jgi:septum formation protein
MATLKNLEGYEIMLVSHSPRRQELLRSLGLDFSVGVSVVNECYPQELKGEEIPMYLSQEKARHCVPPANANTLIIAADTIVCLDNVVYGKPATTTEAKEMLHALSGKTHQVITGVTLLTATQEKTFSVSSDVTFASLTRDEVDYYVEKYLPLDKAGAYGVQEWIGMIGVKRISGSFYNVMGLPVHRLYDELKQLSPCK